MSLIDRRTLIGGGVTLGVAARLPAAQSPGETIALWPNQAPGGEGVTVTQREIPRSADGPADDTAFLHVTRPQLTLARPAKPNGAALMLIPGGGYIRVAIGRGGRALAQHFADAGFHTYTLLYRLPGDGWAAGPNAPLQDAQRALRLIRARARREGYDPARIGALGFSAGGHVAARLATVETSAYAAQDSADAMPLGLKAAGLLYPVILTDGPHAHGTSRRELIDKNPAAENVAGNAAVSRNTPPTFLAHALDDRVVPPENSLAMLGALRAAKVPAECHLFEKGDHGLGLESWSDLFLGWARRHGL
ncbi:alpha/beta hydrolase [Sphingomonas gilva]|uniref:Alpha/beta hydrolase n=1 Tax=Sphingomonas gilva TaxID=2305907 RepID=A0A396RQA6_9SPHN|nr:alpha/beta hydrolase [Sphingomonas gilva]RHW17472.1 alpha/beta hydrolase [Sphingomonas gilva]